MSSLDAVFGLAGMGLILLMSFALFSSIFGSVVSSLDGREQAIKSHYAMEQLLSPGEPANWQVLNASDAGNYGLEKEPSVLDPAKIIALNSTIAANYTLVQERLGLSKYNFSIRISDLGGGSVLYSMGNAGEGNVISVAEVSSLNNTLVMVQLRVAK